MGDDKQTPKTTEEGNLGQRNSSYKGPKAGLSSNTGEQPERTVCGWGRVSKEFRECGNKNRDIPIPSPSLSTPTHPAFSSLSSRSHPDEDKTGHSTGQRLVPFTLDPILTPSASSCSSVSHPSLLLPTWLSPVCLLRSR